jgi:hypothetical protein
MEKKNIPMAQTMQVASSGPALIVVAPLYVVVVVVVFFLHRYSMSSSLESVIKHLVSNKKVMNGEKSIPMAQTMRVASSGPALVVVAPLYIVVVVFFLRRH